LEVYFKIDQPRIFSLGPQSEPDLDNVRAEDSFGRDSVRGAMQATAETTRATAIGRAAAVQGPAQADKVLI